MWDSSAFIGNWPFRQLSHNTPETLQTRLEQEGIARAFVSPLDGLFHTDPQPANRELQERLCAYQSPFFRFVPILNPTLPNWETSFKEWCGPDTAAIRLLPGYGGYSCSHPDVLAVVQAAKQEALPVIVQMRMQDVRAAHPCVTIPEVTWQEVVALAEAEPDARVIAAGINWTEMQAIGPHLKNLPNLFLCLSHMETVDAVFRYVREWGADRLLFGTHAPLFTPTANKIKVSYAGLKNDDISAILEDNAQTVFGQRT